MSDLALFVVRFIATLIIGLLLIPIVWAVATPFILTGALFVKSPYLPTVGNAYRRTASFWANHGILLIDI
jgi:hypothetical protein